MRKFLVLAALALLPVALCAVDDKALESAAESITEAELRDHMYYLADDALAGRMPGEEGYRIAALYAASQFRASGLSELVEDGQGKLTFLQPVPMKKTTYGSGNSIILRRGEEELGLAFGEDYILFLPGETGARMLSSSPVFLGYGISEPEHGWDDFAGVDLADKFVIFMLGAPVRDSKPVLPQELHDKYTSLLSGSMMKIAKVVKAGAGGVIVVPNMEIMLGWNALRGMLEGRMIAPAFTTDDSGRKPPELPILIAHPKMINKMFAARSFNPLNGKGDYAVFPLDDVELDLTVDAEQEFFVSNNVVAVVNGSDPALADEYVTVGAHLDHVGITDGEVFNGADDNASGCVAVLEAAEAVALHPPRRSVIFILYSAEEVGLFGSQYFVDFCPVPLEKIEANINLDMVGRSNPKPPGFEVIGSNRICEEMKEAVIAANNKRVKAELDFSTDESDPQDFFSRSDHFNFHKKGIPTVFLSSGEHPDYHTPKDDADRIDFGKLHQATLLTFDLIMMLADRDEMICAPQRSGN